MSHESQYPGATWNGLTEDIPKVNDYRAAGPVSTRRMINEIIALQRYNEIKIISLPTPFIGGGGSAGACTAYIAGNTIRVSLGDASAVVDTIYTAEFTVDLSEYFVFTNQNQLRVVTTCFVGDELRLATITYTENTLTFRIFGSFTFTNEALEAQGTLI